MSQWNYTIEAREVIAKKEISWILFMKIMDETEEK